MQRQTTHLDPKSYTLSLIVLGFTLATSECFFSGLAVLVAAIDTWYFGSPILPFGLPTPRNIQPMYSQDAWLPSFAAGLPVRLGDWFYRLLRVMGTVFDVRAAALVELALYFCSLETVVRLDGWIDSQWRKC